MRSLEAGEAVNQKRDCQGRDHQMNNVARVILDVVRRGENALIVGLVYFFRVFFDCKPASSHVFEDFVKNGAARASQSED